MTGNLYYWVADWNLTRAEAAQLLHGPVADMVDCTHSAIGNAASAYPTIKRFAVYVTGPPDIRVTLSDLALLGQDSIIVRIDQSDSDLPLYSDVRLVKDVEPGASQAHVAAVVADQRLSAGEDYTIYCDRSELALVESACQALGLPHGKIIGYQWASPTSNPNTRLPGTGLLLGEANVDLSVVLEPWPRVSLPTSGEKPLSDYQRSLYWNIVNAARPLVDKVRSDAPLSGPDRQLFDRLWNDGFQAGWVAHQ